jgi:hypothetical protein
VLLAGGCDRQARQQVGPAQPKATKPYAEANPACGSHEALTPLKRIKTILARTDLAKGEYETSVQYEKRSQQIAASIGPIMVGKPIEDYDTTYDADRGVIVIDGDTLTLWDANLGTYDTNGSVKGEYSGLILDDSDTAGPSYIGQNAFGASVEVFVAYTDRTEIAVRKHPWHVDEALRPPKQGRKIAISVPPLEAKALRESLCIVLGGTPIAPDEPTARILHGSDVQFVLRSSLKFRFVLEGRFLEPNFSAELLASMVGATGIEPVTPPV